MRTKNLTVPEKETQTNLKSGVKKEERKRDKKEESLEEEIEEVDDFNFDGFEVVRREFFSHLRDIAVSFKGDSISFNSAAVAKFPDADFIQLLVNPKEKRVVVKTCGPDDKDAVKWASTRLSTNKRGPRKVMCRLFAAKIYDLMSWNIENRYKIQGNLIKTPKETIVFFDLTETEIYVPNKLDENGNLIRHLPYYPKGWRDSFGLPIKEHEEALKINYLDGYARIEVIKKRKRKVDEANSTNKEDEKLAQGSNK